MVRKKKTGRQIEFIVSLYAKKKKNRNSLERGKIPFRVFLNPFVDINVRLNYPYKGLTL